MAGMGHQWLSTHGQCQTPSEKTLSNPDLALWQMKFFPLISFTFTCVGVTSLFVKLSQSQWEKGSPISFKSVNLNSVDNFGEKLEGRLCVGL